ncbi:hypothetical protein GGR57DRAFT_448650 [Xylariaceae sp. FL1272]|nr:hypothetical protein GGR57DRAFT_448650 [Xylariaceae sp. FL1272]
MASDKVPVMFMFHKSDMRPPLFVAGSFSDPPWQPHEMNHSMDQHGDSVFTYTALVDGDTDVQYKFRIGPGDWWALDPDAKTVTDDQGNTNNILHVPPQITNHGRDDPEIAPDPTAPWPALKVTELSDDTVNVDFGNDDSLMFSHECFLSWHDDPTDCANAVQTVQDDPTDYHRDIWDYDDPRLEQFPVDRDSIFTAMRRLSTSIDADPTVVDSSTLSPVFSWTSWSDASSPVKRRDSLLTEERETRQPSMAVSASRASRSSLQSIAEGNESPPNPGTSESQDKAIQSMLQYDSLGGKRNFSLSPMKDEEDEDVAMNAVSFSPKNKHQFVDPPKPIEGCDAPSETLRTTIGTNPPAGLPRNEPDTLEIGGPKSLRSKKSASLCEADVNGEGNWVKAFLHTVFVDWIGDLVCWLCGLGRQRA